MTLYAYPMPSNMVLPSQQPTYQFQTQPSQPSQQLLQSTPRPYMYTGQPSSSMNKKDSEQSQQQQQQQQQQPPQQQPLQHQQQQPLQLSQDPQNRPQYFQPPNPLTFQQNPYAYGFPATTPMTHQNFLPYDMSSTVQHPYMGFAPHHPPPHGHSGIHGSVSMAAAAQFPSMMNHIVVTPDSVGQKPPPGIKPRVTTTMWEDEGTLCFQVEAKGFCVARREDNNMINGTKLLNVAGMTRGRRDGILKSEKVRHVVKIGTMYLKGVWIPYERALEFAQREQIVDILYPLFVADIRSFLYHPVNYTRTIQVLAAAERKKQADQYRLQQAAAQAAQVAAAQQHQLSLPPPHPPQSEALMSSSSIGEIVPNSSATATPTSLAPPASASSSSAPPPPLPPPPHPPALPGTPSTTVIKSPIEQKSIQTPPVAGQPQMWFSMQGNYYPTTQQNTATPTVTNLITTSQDISGSSQATAPALPSINYQGPVAEQSYLYSDKPQSIQNPSPSHPSNTNVSSHLYPQLPLPHQNQPPPPLQSLQPMQQGDQPLSSVPIDPSAQKISSESGIQIMTTIPPTNPQDYGKSAGATPHSALPPPSQQLQPNR